MSKGLVGLIFIIIAFWSEAQADQIILKNGDRVTGKIVRSDGSSLVIKGDLLGEVTVALASVETITADAPLYVTLADGRTVSGRLTTSGDRAELRASTLK